MCMIFPLEPGRERKWVGTPVHLGGLTTNLLPVRECRRGQGSGAAGALEQHSTLRRGRLGLAG